jgi:antitoxin CptB
MAGGLALERREDRIKRLKFQSSKRGLLEAELVLRPFAASHLDNMDAAELDGYERLLAMEDLDLWELISGRRGIPPDIDRALILQIRGMLPLGIDSADE